MECIYCQKSRQFSDEHVLSRALAGGGEDWMLIDTVCSVCNALFSRFERAWTGAPGIAIMRIAFGPAGRTRRGQAYQFHPSEMMFLEAADDPVAYEVDILPGVAPRLRYQVIATDTDVFPVVSSNDDVARFEAAWNAFIRNPEVTIQKVQIAGAAVYKVARLTLHGEPAIVGVDRRSKPAAAWWDTFGDGFHRSRDSRMSLDPFGRIRFRTRRFRDIPVLLGRIFAAGEIGSSGRVYGAGEYRIACRELYEKNKVERAVAKTLVNYMIDKVGLSYARDAAFRPLLDYCIGGPDPHQNGPFVGFVPGQIGIGSFDGLSVERHGLALASDGERVGGFLKLYGGSYVYRVHLGRSPDSRAFVHTTSIDYNGPGRVSA